MPTAAPPTPARLIVTGKAVHRFSYLPRPYAILASLRRAARWAWVN